MSGGTVRKEMFTGKGGAKEMQLDAAYGLDT